MGFSQKDLHFSFILFFQSAKKKDQEGSDPIGDLRLKMQWFRTSIYDRNVIFYYRKPLKVEKERWEKCGLNTAKFISKLGIFRH